MEVGHATSDTFRLNPRHLIPGPNTGSSLLGSNNGRLFRLDADHLDQQLADGGHGQIKFLKWIQNKVD